MKKILLIVMTLSTTLTLFAQRQMQVWQNGMPTSFAVAEVDSITFEENIDPNVKQLLGVWEGYETIYTLDFIILTFGYDSILEYYQGNNPYAPNHHTGLNVRQKWNYTVSDDVLEFSFETDSANWHGYHPFKYTTEYTITDSTLIMYNFSVDGIRFGKLELLKKRL